MIKDQRKPVNIMKRGFILFLFWAILSTPLSARKIACFPEHNMPDSIQLDDHRLYITEGFTVYIYSLKDFKQINKFGRRGEGPREFKSRPRLHVQWDHILINSTAKVSFYTKTGTFLREVNNIVSGRNFQLLGNRYVGYTSITENDGIRYSGICIYDSFFTKIKNVYKYESIAQSQSGKGWHLFSKTYIKPLVCDNRIVVTGEVDFAIHVFDCNGKKMFTINREYQRVRFTESHKEKVLNLYKTRPSTAPEYDWWKKNIHFPEYFPAIRTIYSADKKIYVRTYREKQNLSEFFVFDSRGNLLKQVFLPIAESQAKNAYPYMRDFSPFVIKNGNLYQLILDEKTEKWYLFSRKI